MRLLWSIPPDSFSALLATIGRALDGAWKRLGSLGCVVVPRFDRRGLLDCPTLLRGCWTAFDAESLGIRHVTPPELLTGLDWFE